VRAQAEPHRAGGVLTALRVYLFADFGKGPRAFGTLALGIALGADHIPPARNRTWRFTHSMFGTVRQWIARNDASAWWLVSCESAAAGRRAIAELGQTLGTATSPLTGHIGTILDSSRNEVAP
jgi:hypothetical protein